MPFRETVMCRLRTLINTLKKISEKYFSGETGSGYLLIIATFFALILANSHLASIYDALLKVNIEIKIDKFSLVKPILLWINDGLMAIFFLLVGLELKREFIEGHLSTYQKAILPGIAAFGGMIVPACFYTLFNHNDPKAMTGWAIPTATDIAFALSIMSLLGRNVPSALKSLLLAIAIFDDLGAIIIIALFYTSELSLIAFIISGILVLVLALLNYSGVAPYIITGVILWLTVLKSGLHSTLAGVITAMFIPLKSSKDGNYSQAPFSLLHHLETILRPWVYFMILPLFAFANSGIFLKDISLKNILHPIPLGIIFGLFLGKQLGVFCFAYVAVKTKIATIPNDITWKQFYGMAIFCGIGFTMSMFIASLAFEEGATEFLGLDRLGILTGTLFSAITGYLFLLTTRKKYRL